MESGHGQSLSENDASRAYFDQIGETLPHNSSFQNEQTHAEPNSQMNQVLRTEPKKSQMSSDIFNTGLSNSWNYGTHSSGTNNPVEMEDKNQKTIRRSASFYEAQKGSNGLSSTSDFLAHHGGGDNFRRDSLGGRGRRGNGSFGIFQNGGGDSDEKMFYNTRENGGNPLTGVGYAQSPKGTGKKRDLLRNKSGPLW